VSAEAEIRSTIVELISVYVIDERPWFRPYDFPMHANFCAIALPASGVYGLAAAVDTPLPF
jgi:hypothetical protein